MDKQQYLKLFKQHIRYIMKAEVFQPYDWMYGVRIIKNDFGYNAIAEFPFNSPETKKIAYELAKKYAEEINKVIRKMALR